MKKYLVIYAMPVATMKEMMEKSTPAEMEQGKQEWIGWMEDHEDQMLDPGNPVGKNTRLSKDGVEEVSNEIAGYTIFKGESKEAVIELLKQNPHFQVPGSYIEVMEVVEMM